MKSYIALGANLGTREKNIEVSCKHIAEDIGSIVARSRLYQTKAQLHPENPAAQPDYLNAVIEVETKLSPEQILERLNSIESRMGRDRSTTLAPWSARIIDLDLLSIDETIYSSASLTLPHPRLHLREFVLEPLVEIAPDWIHPIIKKSALEILTELTSVSKQ